MSNEVQRITPEQVRELAEILKSYEWQMIRPEYLRTLATQMAVDAKEMEQLRDALRVQRDLLEYATRIEKDGRELDVLAFIHNINVALGEVQYTPEELAILQRERETSDKPFWYVDGTEGMATCDLCSRLRVIARTKRNSDGYSCRACEECRAELNAGRFPGSDAATTLRGDTRE